MAEKTFMQKKVSIDRDWKLKIIAAHNRLNQQEALDNLIDEAYAQLETK